MWNNIQYLLCDNDPQPFLHKLQLSLIAVAPNKTGILSFTKIKNIKKHFCFLKYMLTEIKWNIKKLSLLSFYYKKTTFNIAQLDVVK